MTVAADVAGLLANAAGADSCPFVLAEAAHPHDTDALGALGSAIEETHARVRRVDPGFDPAGAERPHVSPNGPASLFGLYDELDDERIAWWFRQLAHTLSERGWSGVLLPQRWEDRPEDRLHGEPWLVVTLALDGWAHREHQVVVPPWTVDPSLVPELVDLAMAWTGGVDGALWFTRISSARGGPRAVAEALRARFVEPGSRGFSTVHRQGPERERRVRFSSYGHVTLEERSGLPLPDRLAALRTAWQPWASRVDQARTTGDVGDGHPSWTVELGRRKLDTSYYPHGRHLDDRRVPDACVQQVLTGAHLDAADDLSRWRVEALAPDRYVVTHPEPSRWFLPAPDGRQGTRVDPDVLDQARDDFGAMILSARDL
jgi:hypothetical protein